VCRRRAENRWEERECARCAAEEGEEGGGCGYHDRRLVFGICFEVAARN